MKHRLILIFAVLAICIVFGSQSAIATLYNVDCGFDTPSPLYSGAAVLGSAGDVWNAYNAGNWTWGPHNVVPLVDSTGAGSSATIDCWNYVTGADNPAGTVANPMALMEDYITAPGWGAGDGWPIKVQLSGLPVSTPYTLVVYAAGDTAGQGATITVTDGSGVMAAATTAADRDISNGVGDAYQTFSGVTDASGGIYFELKTTVDDWHALNGVQLDIVPEPSSIVLLVMGGLIMPLFLRKR
jgi:hypothetical protein